MGIDASGDPMPILGSDGTLVGTLDRLEGDRIRLQAAPRAANLPVTAIASVSAAGLRLNIPADRARALAARDG
jgi:hypothetical protein